MISEIIISCRGCVVSTSILIFMSLFNFSIIVLVSIFQSFYHNLSLVFPISFYEFIILCYAPCTVYALYLYFIVHYYHVCIHKALF